MNRTIPHINLLTHDSIYTAAVIPYPETALQECRDAPNYGDSIVFTQPAKTTDYFIYPLTNQDLSGTYLSWPQGLVMDSKTGAIDLTKSETGQRYSIGFVKSGTTDVPANIVAQVSQNLYYTLNDALVSKGPSARPPLIVIVRDSQ